MRERITWDLNEREEVVERLLPLFAIFTREYTPSPSSPEFLDFYTNEFLHYKIQKNMWGDYPRTGFYEFQIEEWKHGVHRFLFVNKITESDPPGWTRYPDGVDRGGYYFLFETRRSRAQMFADMRRRGIE